MPSTGEEIGPFLSFYRRWLDMKVREFEPRYVIFEAPILPQARLDEDGHLRPAPTNIATTRKLQGLAGVTEMVVHDLRQEGLEVEVREAYLSTVKKAITGSGKGSKPDMMSVCRKCGLAPKSYDEADAFGVWIVGLRSYAKQFVNIWDQAIWGNRGAML